MVAVIMKTMLLFAGLAPLVSFAANPVMLESKTLSVAVDPEFPRLIQYRARAGGAVLDGQPEPVSAVELNGKAAPCKVTFRQTGPDSAEYRLAFTQAQIEASLRVSVDTNGVELQLADVQERGATRLNSFAFPGNALLTVRAGAGRPDSTLAMVRAWGYNECREQIGPPSALKPGRDTANYFFLATGPLAAGITANSIDDCARVGVNVSDMDGVRTCAAQNPVWQRREIEGETLPPQRVRVIITGDRNGDGKAGWQDAALACRELLPRPFGAEFVRETVADQIAMNFASGAQQPFLRILDNIKRAWLLTDGIGQSVTIKGFSAEGHDSANTDYGGHYNERAGGLKDLQFLLERARAYNTRCGVHINATEVYPEAHRYNPEILARDANGNTKGGWAWLDHSHLIDKRKDLLSGDLFASLELMRKELPRLDYVYVDVYGDRGWNAWKLASKLNAMGLDIRTEYSSVFDPWSVWAHQGGFKSRIFHFLWYGDRDLCRDADPLLRAADHVGFMGWANEHDTAAFLRCTFGRNLPTKFLQHFPLLSWEPDAAVFGGGVKVVKTGDTVTCTQEGRVVMTWTGTGSNNRLFVPWNPVTQEKIYVWDEVGGEKAWELPPSWNDRSEVYLYQLTDLGRANMKKLAVVSGSVTLTAARNTPYVLYPAPAPAQPPMAWGEGSPVKDPGFNSHGFESWKPAPAAAGNIRIENDKRGNARLVIGGGDGAAAEVSQLMTGLEPGKTYAASVWVQVTGARAASLILQPQAPGAAAVSNYVTRTSVRHSAPNDPRTGSNYQRLKVLFDLPAGCDAAKITLAAAPGAPTATVEFDDARVVETHRSPGAAAHWFFEDFENVDMGFGPFTCAPDEYTHLSEANPPYTKDTIHGKFSLKSREKNGLVLRTLPSTLRLEPNTRYRVSCETLGQGRLSAFSQGRTVLELKFPAGGGAISGEFATRNDTESYLALYKDGGDAIVIDDLALDPLGAAPPVAGDDLAPGDEKLQGLRLSIEEKFAGPLSGAWKQHLSSKPGVKLTAGAGLLTINAPANVSAFIERDLEPNTAAVECRLNGEGDQGQTWGPGLALLWSTGQALRVNLRGPDGRFGIDSTVAQQRLTGRIPAGDVQLRIRLEQTRIIVEFKPDNADWNELATFPRAPYPGYPAKVRLGKTHAAEGDDDHTDPGTPGTTTYSHFSAYKP